MAGTTETTRVSGLPSGYPAEIDADTKIRFVDDQLQNMSNMDTPILKTLGGIDKFTYGNPKVEWAEEDRFDRWNTVQDNPLTSGATTLTVETDTAHQYPKGSLLKIENEQVRVTAVATASTLTIVRASSGTTAAQHAQNVDIQLVGNSAGESDAWNLRTTSIFDFPFNYSQVFQDKVRVTFRRMESNLYGMEGNDLDYQVAKSLKEQMVKLEGSAVAGERDVGVSGSSEPPTMGGLRWFLNTTNSADANVTDLNSAALTEKDINDLLQDMYYKVGQSNMGMTVLCGAWVRRKITSWYADTVRLTQGANKAGISVSKLQTDFGVLDIMHHVSMPKDELYIINPEFIKIGHHGQRGRFHVVDVATDGPFIDKALYGDYTMMFKNAAAHGRIQEISTST